MIVFLLTAEESIVAILDHVLGPEAAAHFGDVRPASALLEDGGDDEVVLPGTPLLLADLRVQVIEPALANLLRVAEVPLLRFQVQVFGHFVPLGFIFVGSQ